MKKKYCLLLFVLSGLIISLLGVSFAVWFYSSTQKDFNTLGSKCFELVLTNESEAINLDKAYPISDQEGLALTGYSFTIKNTCNTIAAYEVNLEDMIPTALKRLDSSYIKVSINDGTPEKLTDLPQKVPSIDGADASYALTTGSLKPEEEVNYTVKLWIAEDTPVVEAAMDATFESKVSISAGYIENTENEISLSYESQTTVVNNAQEEIIVKGESKNYNLTEYSLDNSRWTRIETPSKAVEIPYTFKEEGTYTFYVKDEMGNINNLKFETAKLDQTAPSINIEEVNNYSHVALTITLTDEKSPQLYYAITTTKEEPTIWQEYNGFISYDVTENNIPYYIWVKDGSSNQTYQVYQTDLIDTIAPQVNYQVLTSEAGSNNWYKNLTLQATMTDEASGVANAKYCFTTSTTCEPNIVLTLQDNVATIPFQTNTKAQRVCINVTDHVGNANTVCSDAYQVDQTDPVAKISASSSGGAITINASGSNDDESGIALYQYSKDNQTWYSSTQNSYTFTGFADGTYTVYLKVTDNVGRTSSVVSTNAVVAYEKVYIAASGNDSSGNGSSSKPYASVPKAYQEVKNGGSIILLSDIVSNSQISLNIANKTINLTSDTGTYTLSRTMAANLINIGSSNTLNLSNIKIDGGGVDTGIGVVAVQYGTTLNINQGTTIIENGPNAGGRGVDNSGGHLVLNAGSIISNLGNAIIGSGVFDIKDGIVYNETTIDGYPVVYLWDGTFNVLGGNIEGRGSSPAIYADGGALNVSGGTMTSNANTIYIRDANNMPTVNISNGTISSTEDSAFYNIAPATITGGTFTASNSNTIINGKKGQLTIDGTPVLTNTSESYPTLYNYGTVEIKNGTFTSPERYALYNSGNATITGGSFSSSNFHTIYNRSSSTMTISGGKITALNYRAVYNSGSLTLSGSPYIENNSSNYPTIYNIGSSATFNNNAPNATIKNLGGGPTTN